jgi:hypothetical protein
VCVPRYCTWGVNENDNLKRGSVCLTYVPRPPTMDRRRYWTARESSHCEEKILFFQSSSSARCTSFWDGFEIPKEKIRFAGTRSILTVWVGGGVGGGGWAGNYPGVGPTYNINLHLKGQ